MVLTASVACLVSQPACETAIAPLTGDFTLPVDAAGPMDATPLPDLARICLANLPSACPAQFPSYATDIAPIISGHCTKCHSPGGIASNIPLVNYADVKANHAKVIDQVYACVMPPASEKPLSDADRLSLLQWIVCGSPDN